jgi:hypothetical protein
MEYRLYMPSLRINERKLAASAGVDWCDYQKEGVTNMEISTEWQLSDRNSMSEQLIFGVLHLPTISIKYIKTLRYECLSYPQKLDLDNIPLLMHFWLEIFLQSKPRKCP